VIMEHVRKLQVRMIDASPFQSRLTFNDEKLEELAASIRAHGVLQPIIVRPSGDRFELIAGERRLRAAKLAGLTEIPSIVRRYDDAQAREAGLIENLQREDISVVEAALAYQRLVEEFSYTQGEIARRTGKSRAAINNTMRLLQLSEPVLQMLDRGELTEGHARALLGLPYVSLQEELAEWIVRNAVPVRETERKVQALVEGELPRPTAGSRKERTDPNISELEERLRQHFGTQVSLRYSKGKGAVAVEFYSDEDLNRILELLGMMEGG
jgi:ParB family chromosome partitioning protein